MAFPPVAWGRRLPLCVLAVASLCFANLGRAENWDRFRGPNGAGQSDASGIPTTWNVANFLWKLPLQGTGHSSPVVWNERLFITSADQDTGEQVVIAVNTADGSILWQRRFDAATYRLHGFNSYASSTPAVDANHVYFLWLADGQLMLAALTHDGEEAWRRDVGPFQEEHGFGKSPVVVDGLVIVANDSEAESAIVAFDALSGDIHWRVPRASGTTAFATPCVLSGAAAKKQLLIQSTASGVAAIDVASGQVAWQGLQEELPLRCVSSPIVAGGLLFVSCGQGGNGKLLIAARPGNAQQGPQEVYRLQQSIPNVPTPVVAGDLLFLWHDRGVVSCHDVSTGQQHWRERVGGDFHSSPLRVGNRIFCASRDGEMIVLAAERKYSLLARNTIGEPCHATPAVANDRLYIRTAVSVLCIGQP
jgi:outer membrane protein assembly factor BamB